MKINKLILTIILIFLFFYLLGAFCNATFNIKLWSEKSRLLVSFLVGVFALYTIVFNRLEK